MIRGQGRTDGLGKATIWAEMIWQSLDTHTQASIGAPVEDFSDMRTECLITIRGKK